MVAHHAPYWKDWKDPRVHLFLLLGSLLLIFISVYNKTPTPEVAEHSSRVAIEFLHRVDAREYARCWEEASALLQEVLSKEQWVKRLGEIRAMTGAVLERTTDKISYTDSAIEAPPGEYVVITYVSKYERKGYVIETITLNLDNSNRWLVAGYYLN